jgi:hypothetical protein
MRAVFNALDLSTALIFGNVDDAKAATRGEVSVPLIPLAAPFCGRDVGGGTNDISEKY